MRVWPTSKYIHSNYTLRNLGNDTWLYEPDLGQDSIYKPINPHSNREHYDTLGINIYLDTLSTVLKIFGYSTFPCVLLPEKISASGKVVGDIYLP